MTEKLRKSHLPEVSGSSKVPPKGVGYRDKGNVDEKIK